MARLATLFVLASLLGLFVPHAAAGVDQCSAPVETRSATLSLLTPLVGSATWMDGSCAATGVVGNKTGSCAAPTGQRCLGLYPAGATVVCEWQTTPGSSVVAVAIGIDVNGDENVWANMDPHLGVDKPATVPLTSARGFEWAVPATGIVIVYVVSGATGGVATDVTLLHCA